MSKRKTKPKRVWMINRFATPPDAPGGTRHYDFGIELAERGYDVSIFAADLNYMLRSRVGEGESVVWSTETGSVNFVWVKTLEYSRNNWRRALSMLTFAFNTILMGMKRKRPHLIIGSSPHLFAAFAAYILAKLRRSVFYLEVRDLWPQTLIDMRKQSKPKGIRGHAGSMFYAVVISVMRVIESLLYSSSDRIIVLTEGARRYIIKRGIPSQKLSLLPNGVYLERHRTTEDRADVRSGLGLDGKFVVMYSGAHGIANALDTIIEAARLMLAEGSDDVLFVLVGDGPVRNELLETVSAEGITNVKMLPAVPKKSVPDMLNAADALVITLRSVELFSYGVSPNKLFEYMASGKPILCAVNGDVAEMVKRSDAGVVIEPENPEALKEGVLSLMADAEGRMKYGENGRRFVEKYFSRSDIAAKLADIMDDCIDD